ncbi:MAG: alkaline phosphatase family protein [Oscillospiraceae bacterium]|jgi:hypothetical protein|nr:alkaline phosphatase family protein [Oscillospiraceae bacterium]
MRPPDAWVSDKRPSILGIPNAILAHFGAAAHHEPLPLLAETLEKGWKNVVLLIFDGMGSDMLERNIPDGFFLRHRAADLASVFPCTTTSALTTYESGLSPAEHGWLGWCCYFPEIGKCVDLFSGHESGTDRPAADGGNIAWKRLGFRNIQDQIRGAKCYSVSPFSKHRAGSCEEVCRWLRRLCRRPGRKYIYAYHFQPDHDMHRCGCTADQVRDMVGDFQRQVERLSRQLKRTLLIVTADHGLKDTDRACLEDYPEIWECFAAPPSREPRNLSFHIKPDYYDAFPGRWNARFGDDFVLMTGEEALAQGIFGPGAPHALARDFVGDYVALAVGNLALWRRNEKGEANRFVANHAGSSPEEMTVPLILIET